MFIHQGPKWPTENLSNNKKQIVKVADSFSPEGFEGYPQKSSHAKNPDPSKIAILRTYTPLQYGFKPFHWRV